MLKSGWNKASGSYLDPTDVAPDPTRDGPFWAKVDTLTANKPAQRAIFFMKEEKTNYIVYK
jgi:hypothetical protein